MMPESLRVCLIASQPMASHDSRRGSLSVADAVSVPPESDEPWVREAPSGSPLTGWAEVLGPHWQVMCGLVSLIRYRVYIPLLMV